MGNKQHCDSFHALTLSWIFLFLFLFFGPVGGILYGIKGSRMDEKRMDEKRKELYKKYYDYGMEEAANRQKHMVQKENREGSSLLVLLREKSNEALDEANRQTDQRPEKAEAENKM